MFEPDSRYAGLPLAQWTSPTGQQITYATRRFLPRGETMTTLAELRVAEGDRLDLIATRTIGDPLQYWRICDANDAMHPDELVAAPGLTVRVAVPKP
jgi:hypothetical protein